MIGYLKIGNDRLTEALHLNVIAVVRTDGNGGVDYVRNVQHYLMDALCVLFLKLLKLGKTVRVLFDLLFYLLCFLRLGWVFLCLTHQHAYLL